ncbi:MAG: hypothetical protein M3Y45_10810 [Actinomycetota bacterium]|nr:hypothetical protein [Actinomycetota bacterium]
MEEKMAGRPRPVAVLSLFISVLLILAGVFGLLRVTTADAARYTVSECGWYVGHDAGWADTSSSKFMRSSYCQPPTSGNAWDGVHLTSETKAGSNSVGGTKFSRWRWTAAPGTAIVNVHGHRWQVVRDNFEHRLGGVTSSGFTPFLKLATTDTARRDFRQSFSPFATAFESRLLCARTSDKRCLTDKSSLAGVRALTFTIDDPHSPVAAVSGALTGTGWMRGHQSLNFSNRDTGSGLRFAETAVDGTVRVRSEHTCSKVSVGGQLRAARMQPCATTAAGTHSLSTATLSDGPHRLLHCAIDFAGSYGCTPEGTILTDNTAPGVPRELTVTGGDGWRKTNGFALGWVVPGQGAASPVVASRLRMTGADGFNSGVRPGSATDAADGLLVPRAGEFPVRVWLVDAAGNELEESSAGATLRFDDIPPTAYFLEPPDGRPEQLRVPVADVHSGVASGQVSIRREAGGQWQDLPTALAGEPGEQQLTARFPSEELDPGVWIIQARVLDRAGNETVTTRRGNGSRVTIRSPVKIETEIAARLAGPRASGSTLRIGYRQRARLTGQLTGRGRDGLGGQTLRVTESPRSGSRQGILTHTVSTGSDGRFAITLRRGASRHVSVTYAGTDRFTRSSAGPFELKVRGDLTLRAGPRNLKTGKRVRFRGRVGAKLARRPLRGSLVAIQYLERKTGRWRPVLVTRTNRVGKYRAGYRFRYITGTARIRLRAVLLPAPGFPYVSAASKKVLIRVRG